MGWYERCPPVAGDAADGPPRPSLLAVARAQEAHVAGAHQCRAPGLARDTARGRGAVQIVTGDGVVLLEVVDAVEPRDVEQDAPRRDRTVVLDAEPRRAGVGHDVGRSVV